MSTEPPLPNNTVLLKPGEYETKFRNYWAFFGIPFMAMGLIIAISGGTSGGKIFEVIGPIVFGGIMVVVGIFFFFSTSWTTVKYITSRQAIFVTTGNCVKVALGCGSICVGFDAIQSVDLNATNSYEGRRRQTVATDSQRVYEIIIRVIKEPSSIVVDKVTGVEQTPLLLATWQHFVSHVTNQPGRFVTQPPQPESAPGVPMAQGQPQYVPYGQPQVQQPQPYPYPPQASPYGNGQSYGGPPPQQQQQQLYGGYGAYPQQPPAQPQAYYGYPPAQQPPPSQPQSSSLY